MTQPPKRPNESDPARDLPHAHGVAPYRHRCELQDTDPVCANCWHLSMPRRPRSPSKRALEDYSQAFEQAGVSSNDKDAFSVLTAYYAGLGYCTLHPPHSTSNGLPQYPSTHVSGRCSQFTHIAEAAAAMERAASGQPRNA